MWQLTAIQVGAVYTTDPLRYHECLTPYEIKVWCIAATDGVHKILVDTGIDGANLAWIHKHVDAKIWLTPDMETTTAVKNAVGWSPEDVDLIINTHLHYDHCGSNRYFPGARIIVQRKEYESAFDPASPQRALYARRFFDKHAISYFRWQFLDGEAEILPGLICLPTPGHTDGHQSVLFHTARGSVCVAGDAATLLANIRENIEMGVSIDSKAVYDSMEKIRRCADFIIPAHEPSIENGATNDFPTTEEAYNHATSL
ncbi:MAG: N-acyl homoserine lactonase family protein [Peptococcaceae bacterium]|nr:N-acyl homoserine lactonase family protein [Peptococcaceae bacterium]